MVEIFMIQDHDSFLQVIKGFTVERIWGLHSCSSRLAVRKISGWRLVREDMFGVL